MIIVETNIHHSQLLMVEPYENNRKRVADTLQLVTRAITLRYVLLGSVGLSVVTPHFPRLIGDIDLGVDFGEKRLVDEFFLDQGFKSKSSLAGKFPFSRIVGRLLGNRYVRYYPNSDDTRGLLPVEILYTPQMFDDNEVRLSPLPIATAFVPKTHLFSTPYGSAIQAPTLYRLREVFDSFVDPIIGKNPKVVADMEILRRYIDPVEYLINSRDIVFRIGSFSVSKGVGKPNYIFPS